MSTRANPVVIGAFVTGSIVIAILGLLFFGSGRFFQQADRYEVFFEGSVEGLNMGAPVNFRGVPIGSVKEINLIVDPKTRDTFVRVVIEIVRGKAKFMGENVSPAETFRMYMQRGLRAQLRMQSVVTGLLNVALDLMPDVPAQIRGIDQEYPEIPAAPTDLETIKNTLSEALEAVRRMPIKEMVQNVNQILDGVNRVVNNSDVKETLHTLNSTMSRIDRMVAGLDAQIRPIMLRIDGATSQSQQLLALLNQDLHPLAVSLRTAADSAGSALTQMQQTLALKNGVPADLAASFLKTSEAARASLDQATKALGIVGSAGSENSQLRNEFTETLKEMRQAARSIRVLSDYLEQHPEALLRGKGGNANE